MFSLNYIQTSIRETTPFVTEIVSPPRGYPTTVTESCTQKCHIISYTCLQQHLDDFSTNHRNAIVNKMDKILMELVKQKFINNFLNVVNEGKQKS